MSWEEYYKKMEGRPLRPLYLRAVSHFENPNECTAIDLGFGDGSEVLDMARRGFHVHGVEQNITAIERLRGFKNETTKLQLHHNAIESWPDWPSVDFLFAYLSFPFCNSKEFDASVNKALQVVKTRGIFAASFLGPEDDWVLEKKCTGILVADLKEKLADFEIMSFEEIKKEGRTALSGEKMWDLIEVVARKKMAH